MFIYAQTNVSQYYSQEERTMKKALTVLAVALMLCAFSTKSANADITFKQAGTQTYMEATDTLQRGIIPFSIIDIMVAESPNKTQYWGYGRKAWSTAFRMGGFRPAEVTETMDISDFEGPVYFTWIRIFGTPLQVAMGGAYVMLAVHEGWPITLGHLGFLAPFCKFDIEKKTYHGGCDIDPGNCEETTTTTVPPNVTTTTTCPPEDPAGCEFIGSYYAGEAIIGGKNYAIVDQVFSNSNVGYEGADIFRTPGWFIFTPVNAGSIAHPEYCKVRTYVLKTGDTQFSLYPIDQFPKYFAPCPGIYWFDEKPEDPGDYYHHYITYGSEHPKCNIIFTPIP